MRLVPDLVLDRHGARRGVAVDIDPLSGEIAAVGPAGEGGLRLPGTALLPGFVNAHSHAFQRGLRGRTERRGSGRDDFWSWREAMYGLAQRLTPDGIAELSARCFAEMRRAGVTAVGEFHYVHHRPDGRPYDDPNLLARRVCEAARQEGLRITLLLVAYARAGAGRAPEGAQRRFSDASIASYLERLEDLAAWARGVPGVEVGAAPHSVRAVPADWLEAIADRCRRDRLPLHVHADEQPREIAECEQEHACRPIELLHRTGALGARTTVVHATHADAHEIELMAAAGATVCACPTTEANLGDGYVPAEALMRAGVPIALGSDSNVRIDPIEEARELELCARRTALRRNVLVGEGDDGPAAWLLDRLWSGGARALGRDVPEIVPGAPADLVAVDLGHEALAGVDDEDLAAALTFGASAAVVRRTWLGGRERT